MRAAIADPLSFARDHRLARNDVDITFFCGDFERPCEDQRIFVEFRSLAGLFPACGLFMRATLASMVWEFTRPIYSLMIFGLLPAASIIEGVGISVTMSEILFLFSAAGP